jgi:hypothetical protein
VPRVLLARAPLPGLPAVALQLLRGPARMQREPKLLSHSEPVGRRAVGGGGS